MYIDISVYVGIYIGVRVSYVSFDFGIFMVVFIINLKEMCI